MTTLFRITALLEGISYLLLFSNMIITKNLDFHIYKKLLFIIGMSHGILFMLYVVLAIMVQPIYQWKFKILCTVLLASLLPFGTFYVEKYLLKKPEVKPVSTTE
jgi:integral membrane protein